MGFNGILMGSYRMYHLVNVYSLLLKLVIERVDHPIKNYVFLFSIVHTYLTVYQRV